MRQYKRWTEEEESYLKIKWGEISISSIAGNLKRTENAVIVRAQRLGLGPFLESGQYVSFNQIYTAMRGRNSGSTYTKKQWLEKGFPIKKQKVKNNYFFVADLEEFWEWAEQHRTLLDFSKLEENILGKEPAWVKDQRKADSKKSLYKTDPWTSEEDELLKHMLNQFRYGYKNLSKRLNRTEGAIKRRILDLGLKQRPVKAYNHNKWSNKEIAVLIEHYHKGYAPDVISQTLKGRSAQACGGKIERMIKDGELQPRSKFRKFC